MFDVTCELDDLARTVDFAMSLEGSKKALLKPDPTCVLAYQLTDEYYCIGWLLKNTLGKDTEGWTPLPFTYDPEIVARIVAQWIKSRMWPIPDDTDGSVELGARVQCLQCVRPRRDIETPWRCVVAVTGYNMTYEK